MVTDGNYTLHGDHFIMYIGVKSLCCTFDTNLTCQLQFFLKSTNFLPTPTSVASLKL